MNIEIRNRVKINAPCWVSVQMCIAKGRKNDDEKRKKTGKGKQKKECRDARY